MCMLTDTCNYTATNDCNDFSQTSNDESRVWYQRLDDDNENGAQYCDYIIINSIIVQFERLSTDAMNRDYDLSILYYADGSITNDTDARTIIEGLVQIGSISSMEIKKSMFAEVGIATAFKFVFSDVVALSEYMEYVFVKIEFSTNDLGDLGVAGCKNQAYDRYTIYDGEFADSMNGYPNTDISFEVDYCCNYTMNCMAVCTDETSMLFFLFDWYFILITPAINMPVLFFLLPFFLFRDYCFLIKCT